MKKLREVDVSSWRIAGQETRGKREKFWVVDPQNQEWLRKEPREKRPYERAIEATVLRMARALGLAAPASNLCCWVRTDGDSRTGIVVRRFATWPGRYEFSPGGDLIGGVDKSYVPLDRRAHTLDRIRFALEYWERQRNGIGLLQQFADMVFFDAWIGNSDRHQENWGILHNPAVARLAPIFDTAACLGAEQLDKYDLLADRRAVRLEEYVADCRSGFGDGVNKKLLKQEQVVSEMSRWPEWKESRRWLPKFDRLLRSEVAPYLASVLDAFWPENRRELAGLLLRTRLDWLKAHVT